MQSPELTLNAALRDSTNERLDARAKAIRNLAPALLVDLGRAPPVWKVARAHQRGSEVVETLARAAKDDDQAMIRATAVIGLGQLGEPQLLELSSGWLDDASDEADAMFQRECALIAMSLLGAGASQAGGDSNVRRRVLERLHQALSSPLDDVRFQAALGVVEVEGNNAELRLVEALEREEHPEVRHNLVEALSRLDPPGEAACGTLIALVQDEDEGWRPIGFEAAMALASAGRAEAGPRLVKALGHRMERDRALEGLAYLGRSAPPDAVQSVHRLARRLLMPGVTRVRAAYALARMVAPATPERDNPGVEMLDRLAWHPRPAVREAVADARAALEQLERR